MKKRVKKLRETLDMTQEQFGEVLGISKSGVSAIESGNRNLTEKHMERLEEHPDTPVNMEWLETGKGPMLIAEEESNELSQFKAKVICMVAHLTDAEWKVLKKIVDEIK